MQKRKFLATLIVIVFILVTAFFSAGEGVALAGENDGADKEIRNNHRNELNIKGHTFNTTDIPSISQQMRLQALEDEETIYIVDMKGRVKPDWRREIEDLGEIINYQRNYAYEVWMNSEQAKKVEKLDFVDWVGQYRPEFKMAEGLEPGKVNIQFIDNGQERETDKLDQKINKISSSQPRNNKRTVLAEVKNEEYFDDLANMNDVYYISNYVEPELHDEMATQIIGGGLWIWDPDDDPDEAFRNENLSGKYAGQAGSLANQLGYTGKGITVAVADTGMGNGSIGNAGHQDFTGRVIGGYDFESESTNEGEWGDGDGHGTHVTGSVAGDTHNGTGNEVYEDYYAAQGSAPESELFAVKIFDDNANWVGPDDYFEIVEISRNYSDSYVHTNSWGGTDDSSYGDSDEDFDSAARNAGDGEPMIITVSAGNCGPEGSNCEDPGYESITSPGVAKNVITVGSTENYNPDEDVDNPDAISGFSSRGWTDDNRVKPDVVAPGERVYSTIGSGYGYGDGTSMSNPAVAGTAAAVVGWYNETYGEKPSPAMVKALLINTAYSLQKDNGDGEHIPNKDEGWGMVNLPGIINSSSKFIIEDQKTLLETGDKSVYEISYENESEPLKISLVWTDKEAQEGDDYTLNNNLDLEVISPHGKVYKGNAFEKGWTQSGQDAIGDFDTSGDGWDDVNNVQNIFINSSELEPGTYKIKINGTDVPVDANNDGEPNQDYALVKYNVKEPIYNLTINSTIGGNTTPNEGTHTYNESDVVNITATADSGYEFVNWTGDIETITNVTANETTINMTDDYSITANFEKLPPISLERIYPIGNINVTQDEFFPITVNVTCFDADCDDVNVSFVGNESLISVENWTPFYTNSSANPVATNLNESQSEEVTIWVNATGDVNTTHTFFEFANLTEDTSVNNITEEYGVTIFGKPEIDFVDVTTTGNYHSQKYTEANVSASSDFEIDTITINLYNSTGLQERSTESVSPFFENFTSLDDGNYFLNATVNDTEGNIAETETREIILDTTPPVIEYYNGNINDDSVISQDYLFVNTSIEEENFANITFRLFNSSEGINKTVYNSSNKSEINWTRLGEGDYYFNTNIIDLAGNENTTDTLKVTLDTTPPEITKIRARNITKEEAKLSVETGDVNGNSTCYIDYGLNKSLVNQTESYEDNESHEFNLTNLSLGSLYYYQWDCSDIANNSINSSVNSFSTLTSIEGEVGEEKTTSLEGNITNDGENETAISFDIYSGENISGIINFTRMSTNPLDKEIDISGRNKTSLYHYQINSGDFTNETVNWTNIKGYYNSSELRGLNESTLKFYRFNTTNNTWEILKGGINGSNNYIAGNTTGFSNFAIAGDLEEPSIETLDATNIGETSATLRGNLTSLGGYEEVGVYFEYGEDDTTNKTDFESEGEFNETVSLSSGTNYNFKAVVEFNGKTKEGEEKSFKTDESDSSSSSGGGGGGGSTTSTDPEDTEETEDKEEVKFVSEEMLGGNYTDKFNISEFIIEYNNKNYTIGLENAGSFLKINLSNENDYISEGESSIFNLTNENNIATQLRITLNELGKEANLTISIIEKEFGLDNGEDEGRSEGENTGESNNEKNIDMETASEEEGRNRIGNTFMEIILIYLPSILLIIILLIIIFSWIKHKNYKLKILKKRISKKL